jgi:RNA-directed DNA polymerase
MGEPRGQLLERILAMENLTSAWEAVAENEGMAGVDDVSIRRWRRNWEERLVNLATAVRWQRYKPRRLRVRDIPKRGGGRRRIGIPTVTDRVLQRATMQVLQWRFERKFLSCSYGYRPRRGVAQAVAAVIRYRDRGFRWLVDADIDDCFHSLDHDLLTRLLEQEVADWRVLQLMRRWMDVGKPRRAEARGVALGMPISPLWANVTLHEMDWRLVRNRWPLVRYADDFVVLAQNRVQAQQALELVTETLEGLELALEPRKTGITCFREGFEFLGVRFDGDSYSFLWKDRRVTVEGDFDWLWSRRISWDY